MAEITTVRDDNPTYLEEWAYDLNEGLTPDDLSKSSGRKVWWRCGEGHEWRVSPNQRRNYGSKCAVCSNRKVLTGFNDAATTHPEMPAKWNRDLSEVLPEQVVAGSHKKVVWDWPCGHQTRAEVHQVLLAGYGCGVCAGRFGGVRGRNLREASPELAGEWSPKNDRSPEDVTPVSGYRAWWKCCNGHEFQVRVCDRVNYRTGCRKCLGRAGTGLESGVAEFLESLGLEVERNNRRLLQGREVDIYLPGKNVAVEVNGLYWHSEKYKDEAYHLRKSEECESQGVQLIHLWEDDWVKRNEVAKEMLARKAGVSKQRRVNARDLEVGKSTSREARKFLEQNHLQGFTNGTIYQVLREGGEILAMAVFKRTNTSGDYRLERFATSAIVRGGFSKLLKAFIREHSPKSIVTFADRGVSDGGLYEQNGFEPDKKLRPDYSYIESGARTHKFNYRLKRFREDPNLKYVEGATERELAAMNNLLRIYDAGKVRWVWRSDRIE